MSEAMKITAAGLAGAIIVGLIMSSIYLRQIRDEVHAAKCAGISDILKRMHEGCD